MSEMAGSDENEIVGQRLYMVGDGETRGWFERQWKIWPKRADDRLTTNIALHYGGVVAFRLENGRDPDMSLDFRKHVNWLDTNGAPPMIDAALSEQP